MAKTIAESFQQFKQNLNITELQTETVSTRQKNVRKAVENDLTVVDSFLTGSYSRNTMIAPLNDADIDMFIVLDSKYFHHYDGQNGGQAGLLDLVKSTIKKTYTKTPDISRNGQAVTIRFEDFTVDVVPGFKRSGGGYLIPNSITQSWLFTDPKKHVELSNQSNAAHNGYYVPLIKMIKAWNRSHSSFFRSFHLEVLALQILNNVTISDYPSGLRFYFEKGVTLISQKNPDPAGYGGDVGNYLNSREIVQEAVAKFQKAYETAANAEKLANQGYTINAVTKWRELLGNYFPSYG